MIDEFPLQWPDHVPRTPPESRAWGGFKITPDQATRDLVGEVQRSGGSGLVISSNRPVRRDGLPMSSAREPEDPGVAVYFTRKGQQVCIPCDSFDRVWNNIRAIGLSIRDMRGPEIRGCAAITDQAFTGFAALPAPGAIPWWSILGLKENCSAEDISAARKRLARELGADHPRMSEINVAHDQGMKERGNG